jgi:hypothetical protein
MGWGAAGGLAMFPVVVAALVLPVLALRARGKHVGGHWFLAAVAVYAACWAVARFWVDGAFLALPELAAGAIVGVTVFRSAGQEDTRWAAWVARIGASFFLEALLVIVLLQLAVHAHLGDTLLPVAAGHLQAFFIVFVLLRRLDRASSSRVGWTGLGVAALGAHVYGCACVVLGARGMPRRYTGYLDRFEHLQIAASMGAFLLLAGLLATIVAHATARRT